MAYLGSKPANILTDVSVNLNGLTDVVITSPSTDQVLKYNGTNWVNSTGNAGITSGTAVASTSGTSIDFTSIPSWVKRITVMFDQVSTNGTSYPYLVQIGDSGGIETSGYTGSSSSILGVVGTNNYTDGFGIRNDNSAATVINGSMTISLLNASTNTWVASGVFGQSDRSLAMVLGYSKSLSGTLDRVRITTANGTDTFDAGTINILYE